MAKINRQFINLLKEGTMFKNKKGFTLIEILLVVVIIGVMLAVIVPRAWRANIDSKYGLVRQAGSELASYASEWTEGQIIAQVETDSSTAKSYLDSLTAGGVWIGNQTTNWSGTGAAAVTPVGRSSTPNVRVYGVVPPEKTPRNPFNGASYFTGANDASAAVIVGALSANNATDAPYTYYALIFLGTDSGANTEFHAGMSTGLEGLRNGVFMYRTAN